MAVHLHLAAAAFRCCISNNSSGPFAFAPSVLVVLWTVVGRGVRAWSCVDALCRQHAVGLALHSRPHSGHVCGQLIFAQVAGGTCSKHGRTARFILKPPFFTVGRGSLSNFLLCTI
jgi:hypothetical protein